MIDNDVVVTAEGTSEKTVDATVKSTVTISAMSKTLTDGAESGQVTRRSGAKKMAEYIDRQAAIKAIDGLHDCYNGFSDTYNKACIIGVIEEIASADVAPVRRGKWVKNEELSSNHVEPIFLCSNCNNFEAWGFTECYPYCPNCGASMDGEQDADEITK